MHGQAHAAAVNRAKRRATLSSDADLAHLLRQFADEIETEGRADLPTIMREAARRLLASDDAREMTRSTR
jgi:hypothetical protein